MINRLFGNWKSTLGGLGVAILTVILNGRSTHSLLAALASAVLGALAADYKAAQQAK